jgi:hypothetical protein
MDKRKYFGKSCPVLTGNFPVSLSANQKYFWGRSLSDDERGKHKIQAISVT